MNITTITAISPLDGRYHEKIQDLRPIFSEFGLMKFRVLVEIRWLIQLCETGKIAELPKLDGKSKKTLEHIIENFSEKDAERIKQIESEINHDVKAVEYFLKEKIKGHADLEHASEFIHFGCTSEDINNLAYGLMLKDAREKFLLPVLENLLKTLTSNATEFADVAMLARTHGQPATPTTVGKEFANFVARLQRQITQLKSSPILGKLNGATGNYNAFIVAYPEINWPLLSQQFVENLGLEWNPYTTQIEPHDYIAELFAILLRVNNILIHLNRDIWNYISIEYFKQKSLAREVGSSTMPHKVNPIDFENAEGNLGIANALLDHMAMKLPISRMQRDLTDSTVLRNMGVALAHCILAYQSTIKGLTKISVNSEKIKADLDAHWEILAEPIQTVMRSFGEKDPYEQLKAFTRGQMITRETLHQFIANLQLSDEIKQKLLKLSPESYTGLARELAKKV
ncbi:MAG TPA: adenylosuccinate lyase [Gammaproteobacteria bacterium]|jgi:adenylosuccinate lyase|nr:adenylosuccinate lyase [Gammaproteobacteria bacterium]